MLDRGRVVVMSIVLECLIGRCSDNSGTCRETRLVVLNSRIYTMLCSLRAYLKPYDQHIRAHRAA
jgi:hypothetical protein